MVGTSRLILRPGTVGSSGIWLSFFLVLLKTKDQIGFVVRRDNRHDVENERVLQVKGVVTHPDPESYTVSREAEGEA